MKIHEIITELRSNPEKNIQKISGHQEAIEFLEDQGGPTELIKYGVSMTKLPKLGINPKSKHTTPLGIYFYPAIYYVNLKSRKDGKLPFQEDAAYIQILKYSGNILDLASVTEEIANSLIDSLYSNIEQVAAILHTDVNNAKSLLDDARLRSATESNFKTPAGKLWYVFWSLSNNASATTQSNSRVSLVKRSSIAWTSLIQLLGFDIVLDLGTKIVYEDEPYQGVIFNPKSVKLVKTIKNIKPISSEINATINAAKKVNKSASQVTRVGPPIASLGSSALRPFLVSVKLAGESAPRFFKFFACNPLDAKSLANNHFSGNNVESVKVTDVTKKN